MVHGFTSFTSRGGVLGDIGTISNEATARKGSAQLSFRRPRAPSATRRKTRAKQLVCQRSGCSGRCSDLGYSSPAAAMSGTRVRELVQAYQRWHARTSTVILPPPHAILAAQRPARQCAPPPHAPASLAADGAPGMAPGPTHPPARRGARRCAGLLGTPGPRPVGQNARSLPISRHLADFRAILSTGMARNWAQMPRESTITP